MEKSILKYGHNVSIIYRALTVWPMAQMDMGAVVEQLQSSGDEELDDAPPQHRRHL